MKGRIVFCGVAASIFGVMAILMFYRAFHFLLYPADWEIQLSQSSDPTLRSSTRGDFTIPFLMSCLPLGFCLIWVARLIDALAKGRRK
jgi:hypothetical protein